MVNMETKWPTTQYSQDIIPMRTARHTAKHIGCIAIAQGAVIGCCCVHSDSPVALQCEEVHILSRSNCLPERYTSLQTPQTVPTCKYPNQKLEEDILYIAPLFLVLSLSLRMIGTCLFSRNRLGLASSS